MEGRLQFDASPPVLEIARWASIAGQTALRTTSVPWQSDVAFDGTAFDGTWISSSELAVTPLTWLRDLAYLGESDSEVLVEDRLASAADCAGVAVSLARGLPDGEAYPTCGEPCLEDLCRATFGSLWEDLGASNAVIDLDIAQSGSLTRDESGALTKTSGSFIATVDGQAALQGTLQGAAALR
jgi:hypothetical protein